MRSAIALILFLLSSYASASPILTMGAGIESRITQDINPDVNDVNQYGELYLTLNMHPWSVLWEIERSQSSDNNGNYSVRNVEYTSMVWGRYEPWSQLWALSPYFGVGLGWQMNDITSQFGAATDTRWGDGGGIIGAAAGITSTFYQHWNVEGELRVAKFELSNGPTWSVLMRSGYTF